ncbi:Regulatory protein NPR2 [Frankliniella fusca]|uniref:Regulatory protein NPR2 n=1 Tax=Frankliniella fusca TaxID=407009 RepID=A0AAE1H763_9NEOP|nr:Regulatory protein NPR2 [Frankliniella fusca]
MRKNFSVRVFALSFSLPPRPRAARLRVNCVKSSLLFLTNPRNVYFHRCIMILRSLATTN